jgi:hypothetical protein
MTAIGGYQFRETWRVPATIAQNAAVSNSIDLRELELRPRGLDVVVPPAWTAANIGVEFSDDGETWYAQRTFEGNLAVITGILTDAAAVYEAPVEWWGVGTWSFMRLTSRDTSDGSAENQTAARSLQIKFKS